MRRSVGSWVGTAILLAGFVAAGEPLELEEFVVLKAETRARLEEWNLLVRVVERLETGTAEQRLAAVEEIDDELLIEILDDPPGDDRGMIEEVVDRLRIYVASEPDPWLVYRIAEQLWDTDSVEVLPLVDDLTHSPVPSVRAAAIDAMFNYLEPEEAIGEQGVARRIEELWDVETYPPARVFLLEAMTLYDVPLSLSAARRCLADENDEIAIAAIDALGDLRPEGWLDLLLRSFSATGPARGREILAALEFASTELDEEQRLDLRSFLEARVDSRHFAWARSPMLAILADLGSDVADEAAREMVRSETVLTAIEGIGLLIRARPADLPQLLSRRAMEGGTSIRARALAEMGNLPWHPSYEVAVLRAADDPRLADGVMGALWKVQVPSSDRAHMLPVWDRLRERPVRREPRVSTSIIFDRVEPVATPEDAGPRRVVVAPAGQETVRCYAAPGHEARPSNAERVAAGHPVSEERFDDIVRSWFEVEVDTGSDCWIDAAHVALSDRPVLRAVDRRREVDVAGAVLRSPGIARLQRLKVLEVFDVGERLAGCRVTVEIEDTEGLAALRDAERLSRTNLAESVQDILPRIRESYGTLDGWDAWVRRTAETP